MTTVLVHHQPGRSVPETGIYGVYFLGSYVSDLRVCGAGEIFPAAASGVTYVLHEPLI